MNLILRNVLICGAIVLAACQSEAQNEHPKTNTPPPSPQEKSIEENRAFLKAERESIERFIKKNKWQMQRSGSGLYYMKVESPQNADSIKVGDMVEYRYKITLLDGTPIRNADVDGNRKLWVGKDQVEIGLHEAFLLSTIGSKMLFIFPAHLAHGLAGNEDNVPPRSTLIYEIEPIKKLN